MLFAGSNNDDAFKMFDNSSRTKWVGGQFPAYFDISLEEETLIEKVVLCCSKRDICIFSVFASEDGENFTEVLTQSDETARGGVYELDCAFTACKIRFLLKYQDSGSYAAVKSVELYGTPSGKKAKTVEPELPEDFEKSEYNVKLTKKDTEEELCALVSRTVGEEFSRCFVFEIAESDEEFFEISNVEDGKIKITANSGACAAAGLNYYYKYYCNVHISQVGNRVEMPKKLPPVEKTFRLKTPFKVRYAYNYCALSYTMAFWGEEEWKKELDYLALQGVNVILDITAIEEVWRRFLQKLGYSLDEARAFITGPAYYAWFNMANIYGVGAPLPTGFFKKHTELARKNHLYMQKMGMEPVLQGYSGMVPPDVKKYVPDAAVIPQGLWNGLERPAMLKTDTAVYRRLAKLFYDSQTEVFGPVTKYFATDPFHEGGRSGRLNVSLVGKTLLDGLLEQNENAIWIIQSWGKNPSKALLNGVSDRKEHTLILDLYAEKKPRWENFLGNEFENSPWVYCMLNNFGGRMGLHGHLETIANEISRASKKASCMKGIGITPEATHSNPIIFDLFFEAAWTKTEEIEPVELDSWLRAYAERRYGKCTDAMFSAMKLLKETVYNPLLNEHGEGAPESIVNARPALHLRSASSWGNGVVAYDKKKFEKAVELFLEDCEKLCAVEGYRFDAVDLLKQVLSNTAQEYQKNMARAFSQSDLIAFMKWSDKFLSLGRFADELLSSNSEFLLGTWLEGAKKLAAEFDDFSKKMFEFNARALITIWAGSRQAADKGGLRDYSNKQWSGLTRDFYLNRWEKWVAVMKQKLCGKKSEEPDWFKEECRWVWKNNEYSVVPTEIDLSKAGEKVLSSYGVESAEY